MSEGIQNIKVKQVVKYGGHKLAASGAVVLTLKAEYGELVHSIEIMQLLNNDITIKAKCHGSKPIVLGIFRIKSIKIEDDGESVLVFDGLNDYIEMDNLNVLPTKNDEDVDELFKVLYEAEIEEEDNGE